MCRGPPAFHTALMSIAVSAVISPSRILFTLVCTMTLIALCVTIAIGLGHVGELSKSVRWLLSSLLLFLAFFGFYHGIRCRKTIQLDISGTGQIRLLKVRGQSSCTVGKRPHVKEIGELVRLMEDSTIWPRLLLLRFRSKGGSLTVVPILPDSVDKESFRALSVACRWISTRNETQGPGIF